MERLPDEVLVLILRRLPAMQLLRAASVCRRWEAVVSQVAMQLRDESQAEDVGKGLRVLLVTAPAPRLTLFEPLLAATNLRHLSVHAGLRLKEHDFAALQRLRFLAHLDVFATRSWLSADYAPSLRRLRALVLNDIPESGLLRALAKDNTSLEELHMYGRFFLYERDELMSLLAVRRLHLRELTLRCHDLRTSDYEAIGACDSLEQLRLYSCWKLTGEGARHVARPRRLCALHVTGTRALESYWLKAMFLALPSGVRELVLSDTCFGDEHVAPLAAHLPRLQILELWRCQHLSPAWAVRLALKLQALRDFDCDLELSPAQLRSLCAHPSLKHVRAVLPPVEDPLPQFPSSSRPEVRSALAQCDSRWLRSNGEGFRGRLFYFWSRELRLPPVAAPARATAFDSDDDDDYVGDVNAPHIGNFTADVTAPHNSDVAAPPGNDVGDGNGDGDKNNNNTDDCKP